MAKKKDGITDLTKLSVIAAEKLTPSQFKLFQSTIFAMLNGVQYGYAIHSKPQKPTKTKKVIVKIKNNKSNVIDFNSYRKEDVIV